jgi:hypothetical protein
MADLLKGFTGGWTFLLAWMLPTGFAIGTFALVILPWLQAFKWLQAVHQWDATTQGLTLGFLTLAFGFAMAAMSARLYRPLEGYSFWPDCLRRAGVQRHLSRKTELAEKIARLRLDLKTEANQTLRAVKRTEQALAEHELEFYPPADDDVVPSRLGNALRALETYGRARYGFDSQFWWAELVASAQKSLQAELDHSRAPVDFFVAFFYTGILFGVTTTGAAIVEWQLSGPDVPPLLIGVVGFALVPVISYRFAVEATSYYRSTVRALVNVGRAKLVKALGLPWPLSVKDERLMWQRITWYLVTGRREEYLDYYVLLKGSPPAPESLSSQSIGMAMDESMSFGSRGSAEGGLLRS